MNGGLYGDLPPPSAGGDKHRTPATVGGGGDGGGGSSTGPTSASSSSLASPAALRDGGGSRTAMAPPTLRRAKVNRVGGGGSLGGLSGSALGGGLRRGPLVAKTSLADAAARKIREVVETVQAPVLGSVEATPMPISRSGFAVDDEYDPLVPNQYQEVVQEEEAAKRAERAEQIARETEARTKQGPSENAQKMLSAQTGEEAYLRRLAMSKKSNPQENASPAAPSQRMPPPPFNAPNSNTASASLAANNAADSEFKAPPPRMPANSSGGGGGAPKAMSVAEKMMAKMGWQEGRGLGREGQGMTTPLMAKKTAGRAGVIVNAPEKAPNSALQSLTGADESKIILLLNIVNREDIDDDLRDEIGIECTKYGKVINVEIVPNSDMAVPEAEAVRVFVEFEATEMARTARDGLNGRFFGGKIIRVQFFPEARYQSGDWMPTKLEIAQARAAELAAQY